MEPRQLTIIQACMALAVGTAGAALASTALCACEAATRSDAETDSSDEVIERDAGEPPPRLRVATWNVGLAPGDIALADERLKPAAKAIAELDVDLVCLQEVWRQDDWDSIAEAAIESLPAQIHRLPDARCAACSPVELDALAACLAESCASAIDDALVSCALSSCGGEVEVLSGGCAGCLVGAATNGRKLEEVAAACVGADPGQAAPSYLYDCGFDTGILTSLEVETSETRVLDSYLLRAAVDHARVVSELGPVDVFCTHLASSVAELEYQGSYGDWNGEQAHQIDQLLDFVASKNGGERPALLLGDLNNGPALERAGLAAVRPTHYARLLDAGFENPYAAQDDVACTAGCPDDTFSEAGRETKLIDHVLVRGLQSANGRRIMTEPTTIDVDGESMTTSLSDHYGLSVTITQR